MIQKRCVVVGGSGHLGQVVCKQLSQAGARVGFTYHRHPEIAQSLLSLLPGSVAHAVDLASVPLLEQACDRLAEQLGGVDAVVHAAAIGTVQDPGGYDKLQDIDALGWDTMMAINVRSAFFCTQRLMPHLAKTQGNIVFVGSIDGLRAVPAPVHYATSKGALHAMALSFSKELGPLGIKVNLIAPGVLEGGLSYTLPDDLRAEYLKHCGLKRTGTFEEVAHLVTYLALQNTYMTGQAMVVDGAL